jgi:hypothetical protein
MKYETNIRFSYSQTVVKTVSYTLQKLRQKIFLDKNGVPFNRPVNFVAHIVHELNQLWIVGKITVLKTDHGDVNFGPRY